MQSQDSKWGGDAIQLQLPACLVKIDGLSRDQHRAICQYYGEFTGEFETGVQRVDVACHAGKLWQAVGLPPEHFVIKGQYVPRKQRLGTRIKLTGFNSVGYIKRRGPQPVEVSLAVLKENEFAQSGVLQNFLRVLLAYHVLDHNGVLLHSAGVLYKDQAYLFCGRSNAGKTTLARKAAAAGARVLSDDINLVIPEKGGFRAHKVPFTGEFGRRAENLSGNGSFPLGGLALLEKAPALTAAPVRSAEAVAGLLTGCPFVNDDPEEFPALLDILTKLVANTPVIRLGVGRDDPFEAVMDTLLRHCKHD